MKPVKISDYRYLAERLLKKEIFDYIDGGACDEITKKNNRRSFDSISLSPLCLRDVSHIDKSLSLLGFNQSAPILIAPMAFHQLVDSLGEISTAKAAKSCGLPLIVSSMSNKALEVIAKESQHDLLWLQLYLFKDRSLTEALIRRAEKAGYKAIIVTVGVPFSGKRERDIMNQFSLPPEFTTGNFKGTANSDVIYNFTAKQVDPSLTWRDIEWIQSLTRLPIILKGILNPLDADEACRLGISGIVVSNHGGRQLDTAVSAMTVLPDIVNTVCGRTIIFLDGAVERGTDILKAIAYGADAVLIGRPVLWALAIDGDRGLSNMLTILINEFEMAMKLTGCCTIQDIKRFAKQLIYNEPNR